MNVEHETRSLTHVLHVTIPLHIADENDAHQTRLREGAQAMVDAAREVFGERVCGEPHGLVEKT